MRNYKAEICEHIDNTWDDVVTDTHSFIETLKSSKYICLFGAKQIGIDAANSLIEIGIKVDFFCDNNEMLWGEEICFNIKCISVKELEIYKGDVFILISTGYYKEVYFQLELLGFNKICVFSAPLLYNKYYLENLDQTFLKRNICQLLDILKDDFSKEIVKTIIKNWFKEAAQLPTYDDIVTDNTYFPGDIIDLSDDEIFIDVGAFDGDTINDYVERKGSKFNEIVAYELDKINYDKLENNIEKIDENIRKNICIYNKGLYNKNTTIHYKSNIMSSNIVENSDQEGEVVKLSDHLKNKVVTFIKMDIEGAELEALEGARDIIRNCEPKLAICIYHKPQHLWEIPFYIKRILPEYELYIRHHSKMECETVCYAIQREKSVKDVHVW